MEKFLGTPGPWEKHVRKGRIHAVIPKYYGERRLETVLHLGSISEDDCCVETCCCVEEHSNARLIANAPDLLKICLMIKEWGGFMNSEIDYLLTSTLDKIIL